MYSLIYLRGFHRGRKDALDGQPPLRDLSGDFKAGYLLAYRCFKQHTAKTWQTPA